MNLICLRAVPGMGCWLGL